MAYLYGLFCQGHKNVKLTLMTKYFFVDFSGHHVPSVQSRLRTISNLTRKLSLSNSRIIENPSRRLSASSSTSRLNNNGIGKAKKATTKSRCCHQLLCWVSKQFAYKKRHFQKKKFRILRTWQVKKCCPETCNLVLL